MEEIIEAIHNAMDAEKKVEAFFALSDDEKQALIEKLQGIKTETLGIFLNAIYPEEKNKKIQKLIRKLLFKLKSSGIKVEEPRSGGEPVIKKIKEVYEQRGFMSNYDPTQTRIVVAGFEIKRNTFVFLNAEMHFAEGLHEVMTAPIDKKGLNEIFTSFRNDTRLPMVLEEVSPAYAVYLIEEGSQQSGRFREEVKSLRSFAANIFGGIRKPDEIYTLPIPNTSNAIPSESIFDHPIFQDFILTWKSIEEDRKTYHSSGGSAIVLPPHMAAEKKGEFLKTLAVRSDIKHMMPLLKRVMEDYAYLFHCMREYNHYKGLIEFLKQPDALNKVFSRFLIKSLEKGEQQPQQIQDDGGILVNPYG